MRVLTAGETMALLDPVADGPLALGSRLTLRIAGAESNFAIALTRLGAEVTWVSALGDDPYGDIVEATLRAEGVRVVAARDAERPTGVFIKWRENERTQVSYHRHGSAATGLHPSSVPDELLEGVRLVHLTGITTALGPGPRALIHDLARRGKAAGAIVLFDPNWRPALWASPEEARAAHVALLPWVDWYLCGFEEGQRLWGAGEVPAVVDAVRAAGAGNAVVRVGARGAYVDGTVVPPAEHVATVDEIGAGDGFAAGFARALLDGRPAEECVRMANAVAAAALLGTGDWETYPRLADLAGGG